jgi:hypothetical protein
MERKRIGITTIILLLSCILQYNCKQLPSFNCDLAKKLVVESINDEKINRYYMKVDGRWPAFFIDSGYKCSGKIYFEKFDIKDSVNIEPPVKGTNAVAIEVRSNGNTEMEIVLIYLEQGVKLTRKYLINNANSKLKSNELVEF